MEKLSKRERQVAEVIAWGAATKEAADMFNISTRTVENIQRNIYRKLGIQKATELSAWWFCTHFHISFDLSPLKRTLIALFLLFAIVPKEIAHPDQWVRAQRTRTVRTGRRTFYDDDLLFQI